MTMRSKFVFQTVSPVREQSVQNVVLVPQNLLEQICLSNFVVKKHFMCSVHCLLVQIQFVLFVHLAVH